MVSTAPFDGAKISRGRRSVSTPTILAEPVGPAAATYLPQLVLGAAAAEMRAGFVPIEGSVALVDITGFTPLSERLAARGKEGAEWLTQIINVYFQRLLDAAVAFGGDNLKFGGDAVLLLFRGERHADRAVAVALAMQNENRRAGAIRVAGDRTRLQMRISVHSDVFWSAIAGSPGLRLQQVVAGPAFVRLAELDKQAAPGEIALSPETRAQLESAVTTPRADGVILAMSSTWRMEREAPGKDSIPERYPEELARWGIATGAEGEHRKVVVLFARLDGLNELIADGKAQRAFEALERFVQDMGAAVAQFGGYLASNDVDGSGVKFIILLGAPVANEQSAANAFRLALALREAGNSLGPGLQLRIGINSGYTFCGDVGADHRREYTVLGDAVNLSARLMSRAEDSQILVSETTADEAGSTFAWRQLDPLLIKGKALPVHVRQLEAERRHFASGGRALQFVGRSRQVERLRSAADAAEGGSGQVMAIEGEPGSGKSRLLAEFTGTLEERGWTTLRGAAQSFTVGVPFSAWTGVLNGLLGLGDAQDVATRTSLAAQALSRLDPALGESAALLNPIMALSLPESEALRSLDAENRRRRLYDLFGQMFLAAGRQSPTAIVLEDLQWADESTREVLDLVVARVSAARLLLCVTSRETVELTIPHEVMRLGELSHAEARLLLDSIVDRGSLDEQVALSIVNRCQGNPLFIEEVGRALTLEGLKTSGGDVLLPDRLQSLLLLRLDSLSRLARRVARLAAVVGTQFEGQLVRQLLDAEDRLVAGPAFNELISSEILAANDGSDSYRFRHSLQQEVVYESLLFARRRELHGNVMRLIRDRHGDEIDAVVETIAYHARLSGRPSETARFAALAGEKSQRLYAWESAISYYQTAIASLAHLGAGSGSSRSLLLERTGDCREVAGRPSEAARAYIAALEAWNRAFHRPGAAPTGRPEVPADRDEAGRGTRLRLKIAVSLERHAQYDRSLRWLRSAEESMPPRRADLRADLYSSWSVVLFRKGQFRPAIEWAKKALTAANRTGQASRIAYSHHVLANAFGQTGRLRSSVLHREAALELYEQLGDLPRLMTGHGNLGLSYQSLGEFKLALEQYEECIKTARQIGNSYAVAIGNLNLGEVVMFQGNLAEAAKRFELTISNYRDTGEARVPAGLALINLSRVKLKQGELGAAARCQEEGMELLGSGSRGLAAEGLLQEAEIELARGHVKEAGAVCERVLREARELGVPLLEARAQLLESQLQASGGHRRDAETAARQSLVIARRLGAAYEMALALFSLAHLANSSRKANYASAAAELFARVGAEGDAAVARALAKVARATSPAASVPTRA